LRKIYQHMIRFDERLANVEAMVENKLTSPNHKMAQPAEMAQTPVQCREYNWLNESTRHFSQGMPNPKFCDSTTYNFDNTYPPHKQIKSPDWKGEGWYRFGSPEGRIANSQEVKSYHKCGGFVSGFLKDSASLPHKIGETKVGTVTHNYHPPNIIGMNAYVKTIEITKCLMHFVFKLKEPPSCSFIYCSA